MKQRLITLALLVSILLVSIKLVLQFRTLHVPIRHITFTCAVAVESAVGQVCIRGDVGAQLHITITYCTDGDISSPAITEQEPGTSEYRWTWLVHQPTICAGKPASAQASASWIDGGQALAQATFYVAAKALSA